MPRSTAPGIGPGSLDCWVRLMPPAYVKPSVKRQKNDVTDAEAICEAVTPPAPSQAVPANGSGGPKHP
jgi:transposase